MCRSSRTGRGFVPGALGAYCGVFLLLTGAWLPRASSTISGAIHGNDAEWTVWVLAWVAHAIVRNPAHLFDANINFPAPRQLAGSDHYLSSQLLFAPLFWLTGNPVLATNVVMLLSYPLAGLAMACLLRALGCGPGAAWAAGLIFSLGPRRVPANLMFLEYLNLYLPLVALALMRLRTEPSAGRTLALWASLTAGVCSSYYMAAMLGLTAAVWGTAELLRQAGARVRFLVSAGLAGGASLLALRLVSGPYLGRATEIPAPPAPEIPLGAWISSFTLRAPYGWGEGTVVTWLCLLGLLALARRDVRRIVALGLVLVALASVLTDRWALIYPRLPDPMRFFRTASRLQVVKGFGTALLAAAGLEAVRRLLGARAGTLAAVAASVAVVGTKGTELMRFDGREIAAFSTAAPIYAAVARVAEAEGRGPLMQLPLTRSPGGGRGWFTSYETEAMIGSARHWLPLVGGYTGYQPPHRGLFLDLVEALPASQALADLVDMTHLRFILLRPARDWERPGVRMGLLLMPGLHRLFEQDGWILLRVERAPMHPQWFAAIAGGRSLEHTVLGTSLAPLSPDAARARVSPRDRAVTARAGTLARVALRVENLGTSAWPVSAPPTHPAAGVLPPQRSRGPYVVELFAQWRPLDEGEAGAASPALAVPLGRDIPAGESLDQTVALVTPSVPGRYELSIGVRQVGTTAFDGPENPPMRIEALVTPPSSSARP